MGSGVAVAMLALGGGGGGDDASKAGAQVPVVGQMACNYSEYFDHLIYHTRTIHFGRVDYM
jgi:hypothetical protein